MAREGKDGRPAKSASDRAMSFCYKHYHSSTQREKDPAGEGLTSHSNLSDCLYRQHNLTLAWQSSFLHQPRIQQIQNTNAFVYNGIISDRGRGEHLPRRPINNHASIGTAAEWAAAADTVRGQSSLHQSIRLELRDAPKAPLRFLCAYWLFADGGLGTVHGMSYCLPKRRMIGGIQCNL